MNKNVSALLSAAVMNIRMKAKSPSWTDIGKFLRIAHDQGSPRAN
jgi:hypothetical protein